MSLDVVTVWVSVSVVGAFMQKMIREEMKGNLNVNLNLQQRIAVDPLFIDFVAMDAD